MLDIDSNFQFVSDIVDFKFTGRYINRTRKKSNKFVQIVSILYKESL